MELGEYPLAREAYQKTLELDPYNSIAKKNLSRLSYLEEEAVKLEASLHRVKPQQFIEEVGKAGLVNLLRLAPPSVMAKTVAGDKVNLKIDGANLVAENSQEEYLGFVEPRHGQRLIKLIEGGNKYEARVVSASEHAVTVIIKEVYQHPSQVGRLSFPVKTEGTRTSAAERIIRRGLEQEEASGEPGESGEPAFTVVGGEEAQIIPEESADVDEDEGYDEEWGGLS